MYQIIRMCAPSRTHTHIQMPAELHTDSRTTDEGTAIVSQHAGPLELVMMGNSHRFRPIPQLLVRCCQKPSKISIWWIQPVSNIYMIYIYTHMYDSAGCLAGHVFRLVSPPKFMGTRSVSTGLIYNLHIFLLTFWQLNHIFTPGFCRFNPHIFGELPWVVPVSGRGWTPACSSARLCRGTTAAGGARRDEASAEFHLEDHGLEPV